MTRVCHEDGPGDKPRRKGREGKGREEEDREGREGKGREGQERGG